MSDPKTSSNHLILIVEDVPRMAAGIELNLAAEGYRTLVAGKGSDALHMAVERAPSLIILDIGLPDMDGFEVCRELRQRLIQIPIIILTARSEEIDKVVGLRIGADDYVTKPFSIRELTARVAAQLRRAEGSKAGDLLRYRFGAIEIDFQRLKAHRSGKPLALTVKEFEILRLLIQSRGGIVTRERLLERVFGYERDCTTRTVDAHIFRIRRKIEDDPGNPVFLVAVYGGGYMFVD